jgi:hypothetical protein
MSAGNQTRKPLGAALRAVRGIVRSRPINVLLIALLAMVVLAAVARMLIPDRYVWFSAAAVCAVVVVLAIAAYDLVAELFRLPYLMLDQRTALLFAVQVLIVPVCLLAGIFLGHLYWH